MEFKLNEDQQMIHDLAKDFAESVLQPRIDEIEAGEMTEVSNGEKHPQLPHDIHQQLAECGFIGISFPEEYNGLGMGHVEQAIVIKELSRISPLRGQVPGRVHPGPGSSGPVCFPRAEGEVSGSLLQR